MVCGDPVQIQQEVTIVANMMQVFGSIPIIAILSWQAKNLLQAIKEFKAGVSKRLCRKKK